MGERPMGAVSDIFLDKWIDPALKQLEKEQRFGLALIEFARSVADKTEVWDKLQDSDAGHAADIQIKVMIRELQLWCCRIWDKKGNSLRQVARRIFEKEAEIVIARRKAHSDWTDEQLGLTMLHQKIAMLKLEIERVFNSEIVLKLRVTRNEQLAHLLEGISGDRRTHFPNDTYDGYSLNEVLTLADETISLLSAVAKLWSFTSYTAPGTAILYRLRYEAYWRFLPKFSELEQAERMGQTGQ
jgi:hypothetical protein